MLLLRRGEVCERCAGRRFHHAIINKCVKDSLAASAVCAVEETLHRWTRIYERNVDVIISPSEFLKNRMVDHGRLPADKVLVLPNYADTNSIYPDYTPGDYGLFIGKVESIKGIWTLLEACRQIPDFEIRFAGRGDILEDAVRYCETEGITNAKFLGFQTGEDLARLRRESRFVVVPSEWYENCPMVILEAFAAGKPVIASRMGGVPELIDQSADGLMFDAGDSDSLAGHMRTLIGDAQLASEMGRKGRQKVEGRYSMSAYMDSLLAIYHDLAPNK
jgi:glycosyltransferase involved in cell wall biosynthesis